MYVPSSKQVLLAFLGASLLWGVPAKLHAQDEAELTPEEINEQVAEAERQGFEAMGSQDWGTALFHWSQVLSYKPERTHLLYYSALACFKNNDIEGARRFGLKARNATPPLKDELASKNEALLAEIAKLEAEAAAKRAEELEARKLQRQISSDVRPRASGWIWVGAGALALSAAGFGGAAWQADKLVEVRDQMALPQTRPEYDALREEADGYQLVGNIFLWSGVALAATGVSIIVWDLMTPEGEEPAPAAGTLGVGVTPNGAFVRLAW